MQREDFGLKLNLYLGAAILIILLIVGTVLLNAQNETTEKLEALAQALDRHDRDTATMLGDIAMRLDTAQPCPTVDVGEVRPTRVVGKLVNKNPRALYVHWVTIRFVPLPDWGIDVGPDGYIETIVDDALLWMAGEGTKVAVGFDPASGILTVDFNKKIIMREVDNAE